MFERSLFVSILLQILIFFQSESNLADTASSAAAQFDWLSGACDSEEVPVKGDYFWIQFSILFYFCCSVHDFILYRKVLLVSNKSNKCLIITA